MCESETKYMEDKHVFHEINERDMQETPDVTTVLDETIPSPARIQTEETVELPEIQTMPGYIRTHYEKEILASLMRMIRCGELGVQCGGKLLRETSHTASGDDGKEDLSKAPPVIFGNGRTAEEPGRRSEPPVSITPLTGKITWMGFRRVGLCFVEADLVMEVEAEIRSSAPQSSRRVTQRYRADMYISMENGIDVEYGNFRIHRYEEDRDGIRLDEYLIPVFQWKDIEEEAESIIFHVAPEGLHNPEQLRPAVLAGRLGLKIIHLPLYQRDRTASILFFDAGEVLVCQDVQQPQLPPVPARVEENTIVVNSMKGFNSNRAIMHECFHYVEHQLFFQLQQLHNSDVMEITRWKRVDVQKKERGPVEWMEWQAHVGSQCLLMPRTRLCKRLREELDGENPMGRHIGYRLEAVGRTLAKEYGVRNYQMRNRMIQLGYTAAKGALNFVDDGYIEPFAFSADKCRGSRTFVISPKEALEEYVRNEAFRKLLDTGQYVYADGHICVNDPAYVVQRNGKPCLTEWANAHVDACCLRFMRSYYRDTGTRYVYGQLNSDEEYNGRSLALSASEKQPDLYSHAVKVARTLSELPGTFRETFEWHMKKCKVTLARMSEETALSERSITRYRTEEKDDLTIDRVAKICICMHLEPEFSFDMLEKAGIHLRKTPEDLMIKAVLLGMYACSVNQVGKYLEACKYPRLKEWKKAMI